MISPHEAMKAAIQHAVIIGDVDDLCVEATLQSLDDQGYRLVPTRAVQRQGEAA